MRVEWNPPADATVSVYKKRGAAQKWCVLRAVRCFFNLKANVWHQTPWFTLKHLSDCRRRTFPSLGGISRGTRSAFTARTLDSTSALTLMQMPGVTRSSSVPSVRSRCRLATRRGCPLLLESQTNTETVIFFLIRRMMPESASFSTWGLFF